MKVGNVERLVLLVLKRRMMNARTISTILRVEGLVKTSRSVRRAVQTLGLKGLIDNSNKLTHEGKRYAMKNGQPSIDISKVAGNTLGNSIKLGTKEKTLLYILSRIDRAALQFLAMIASERTKYTSEILKRLEKKGLVYGYRSIVLFTNREGKTYRPKYYRITDSGRTAYSKTKQEISDRASIDLMLEKMSELKSELSPS